MKSPKKIKIWGNVIGAIYQMNGPTYYITSTGQYIKVSK